MGKVKSRRQRLHSKAAKLQAAEKSKNNDVNMDTASTVQGGVVGGTELFGKVNIDLDMLTKQLDPSGDGDTKSVITSRSLRGMNLKKKDKRKLKQEFFMKKIDGLKALKKEAKEKKKRQQTAVVGDMKPLEDTLPTLQLLLRDHKQQPKDERNESTKQIMKEKKRKQNMAKDIDLFQQVLQHPAYKSNPLNTISEHLQNKMQQEADT